MLHKLLNPPEDLEHWFLDHLSPLLAGPGVDVGCEESSFQEQQRHWWSNESPVFVAERWCTSVPCVSPEGQSFDGTIRVGFALRRKASEMLLAETPEDLAVDWLGGYWK